MKSEMRLEVVSLMLVRPVPQAITMTVEEVRALIEYHDGQELGDDAELPGCEGASAFDGIFVDEVEVEVPEDAAEPAPEASPAPEA